MQDAVEVTMSCRTLLKSQCHVHVSDDVEPKHAGFLLFILLLVTLGFSSVLFLL